MNRHEAIAAIQDEHRSISAVIHGLQYLAGEVRAGRSPPDLALLRAMLRYVREYPERLHHPAEDRTLFALLRKRTSDADALVSELEAEHAQGEERLARLGEVLDRLEAGATGAREAFQAEVLGYANFHWQHMRKEEEGVLPVAERKLVEEDWEVIGEAFRRHADPRFGGEDTADDFRRLFSRIVALAPPPIGVGPPRADGDRSR